MTTDASPPTAAKPTRRRWLRYSLRSLLLVMLLCACGAAWLGYHIQIGRDQLAAIAWVEEQGGEVQYHISSYPRWQLRWLGHWYPDPVTRVDLSGTHASQLALLKPFANLEALRLAETPVDDLSPLAALRELRFLDLTGTNVKEEQITRLQTALPELIVWQPVPAPQPEWRLRMGRHRPRVVNAEGKVLWDDAGPSEECGNFFLMGHARSDSHLYFSTFTTLRSLNTATGQVEWQQERQVCELQYLAGSLFGVEGFSSISNGVIVGLDSDTGEEFLRMELGEKVFDVRLQTIEGFLVVNYVVAGAQASRVLDPQGNVRASFSQPCYDLLSQGDDLICGLADSVQRVAPDQKIIWSAPLTTVSGQQEESLHRLAGGDLLVLNYDAQQLNVLEVNAMERATGRVRWSGSRESPYSGRGMPSPPQQWHVEIVQSAHRIAVIAQSNNPSRGPLISMQETSTGLPIGLWYFNID